MRLHPRTLKVSAARNAISVAICEIWQRDGLTPVELVSILTQLAAEYSKYPLRDERHPNSDKRADEE
jgi:hypothetical protein